MALPSYPNSISLSQIQAEFGGANPIGLNEYYSGGSYVPSGTIGYPNGVATPIPTRLQISLGNFHGAQFIPYVAAFAGGLDSYNNININTIQLLSLTNETTSTSAATFAPGAYTAYAGASAISLMYTIGYYNGASLTQIKDISKYLFTTETSATTSAQNNATANPNSILNNTGQFFYWTDLGLDTRKFTVSSETEGPISALPTIAVRLHKATGYNTTYGWLIGGQTGLGKTSTYTTAIQKMTWSSETFSTTSAVSTDTTIWIGLTGPTICVWQSSNASVVYIWEKLTYSTDTASAGSAFSSAHKVSTSTFGGDTVSSSTKGYYVPENNLTNTSSMYGKYIGSYTYSTDTVSILSATFGTGQISSSASQSRNP